MDTNEQIKQLRDQLQTLQSEIDLLKAASSLNPDILRTFSLSLFMVDTAQVTDYDQAVNESGASAYTVAAVPNGFYKVNGKLIPFYNVI